MAAKRGKNQARRAGGNGGGGSGGMPGWAWLVVGAVIALGAVFAWQHMAHRDKDGFFRPTPNPDAQPKTARDDAVVDDETDTAAPPKPAPAATDGKKKQDYDFYTLLPGKEVPMTDAELAASEQAEKADKAQQDKPKEASAATPAAATSASGDAKPLPAPVDDTSGKPAKTATATSTVAPAAPASDSSAKAVAAADTHYVLQAGAFQASGQAEELKARIALLGVGARVESAQIGGKTVYRVRMGPYGTASELADAKRKLAAGGLSAMAVRTN